MNSAKKMIKRLKALMNRDVRRDYYRYCWSRLIHGGKAELRLHGICLEDFPDFTEYHGLNTTVSNDEFEFLSAMHLEAGVIMDIGASYGLWSLLLAKRFPDRQIYAFEPNPYVVPYLKANIERNAAKSVDVYPYAVSAKSGEVFFEAKCTGSYTSHMILRNVTKTAVRAPSFSIDDFVCSNEIDQIAFIKIDVEGFETEVLRGAEKCLREKNIRIIYMEVCPALTKYSGYDPEKPIALLEEAGYSWRRLEGNKLLPVTRKDVENVGLENWVACLL